MVKSVQAKLLLNKVVNFERATPTDLNVIIRRVHELAVKEGDDLSEIGQYFYSHMMKRFFKEDKKLSEKRKVRMTDPSQSLFSEYLRRVYTFGCW